jgi:hypothetical protein
MRVVEIYITAAVPEGADTGHEAIYRTRDAVAAIVAQLEEMGLTDAKQTRRLITSKQTLAKASEPRKPVVVKSA